MVRDDYVQLECSRLTGTRRAVRVAVPCKKIQLTISECGGSPQTKENTGKAGNRAGEPLAAQQRGRLPSPAGSVLRFTWFSWTRTTRIVSIFAPLYADPPYCRPEHTSQLHLGSFDLLTDERRGHTATAVGRPKQPQPVSRGAQRHRRTSVALPGHSIELDSRVFRLSQCVSQLLLPRPRASTHPPLHQSQRSLP